MTLLIGDSSRPRYVVTNVSTSSSVNFDPTTMGQLARFNLTNNITVTFGTPSSIVDGACYKFILKAADGSARTFAWSTAYKFPGGVPVLTSGTGVAGGYDSITFIAQDGYLVYDGSITNVY